MANSSTNAMDTDTMLLSSDHTNDMNTFNEIRFDNNNFEYHERQFQEVLMGLENNEVLEAFRVEYAALHHSFLKSHDGETRLLKKCAELQADIEACAVRVQTAEELTRGDKSTIESLKTEIEKTQKRCLLSKERETLLKDKVSSLKRELRDIEERSHQPIEATEQETALQSLVRLHETLLKEKETLEYQLSAMRQDYAGISRRYERLQETQRSRDMELRVVCEATDEKLRQADVHKAERLRKEEELRQTREKITRRAAAAQERQAIIEQLTNENGQHDSEMKRIMEETARLTESYQLLSRQLQNVNRTSQTCNEENDALQRRMNELMEELKAKEAAFDAASRAHRRELKILDAAIRRNTTMECRRAEAEAARAAMRDELEMCEEELAVASRAADAEEKRIAAEMRKLDALQSDVINAKEKLQKQSLWLAEQRAEVNHLEHELRSYEDHAQKQNAAIYKLTHECVGYEEQIKLHTVRCAKIMAEVQERERQLTTAVDEVRDVEARLQQQQSLMEAILDERKAYTKHYTQIRSEMTGVAQSLKLMLAQIKNMQEEVERRERQLAEEDGHIEVLTRQKRVLESHINMLHARTNKRSHLLQQLFFEVRRLGDICVEAEDEVGRQCRRCRDVQNERDMLNNKVVDCGEELTRLYEKVREQNALLRRGETMYIERLKTIQELHSNVARLSDEIERLRQFAQRLPELRRIVNAASRELVREKNRVRALLDECERPMNLHPNHQLSSSEPETFALAEKVSKLQRELVDRHVELAEKERRIQQQEQAYLQCKAAVARQLGPETAERITLHQSNLAKKTGQVRAMMESLKYFREQTEVYQERYNELRDTLDRLGKTYAENRLRRDIDAGRRGKYDESSDDGDDQLRQQEKYDEYVGFIAPPYSSEITTAAVSNADAINVSKEDVCNKEDESVGEDGVLGEVETAVGGDYETIEKGD